MINLLDIAPAVPDSVPTHSQEIEVLKNLPFDELMNRLISSVVTFAINLAIAIFVFYVGKIVINKIYRFTGKILVSRQVDTSIMSFTLSMVRIVLYFILIVTIVGILGIETSSFIALFASAGVAIGMALSGTLQNFAGGVLILLLKPYRVGDFIEVQGYAGTVREIQIFSTIILTPDNKSIIIPNGGLSTGSINNYSREEFRRVEWSVGISYGDSVDAARAKIMEILNSDPRIEKQLSVETISETSDPNSDQTVDPLASAFVPKIDRSPLVQVKDLGESSVDLRVIAWVKSPDYWGVFYDIYERIYKELPLSGVSFPFPQLDVHLDPSAKE